jgi:hypothetical protein
MSIISRQEQIDGNWFTWVTKDEFTSLLFETDHQMTEEEAQIKLDEALTPIEEENGSTD